MASDFHHRPVLLEESVEQLHLAPGARIVDGTIGGGGHAAAILDRLGPEGMLIGLDRDATALAATTRKLTDLGLLDGRVQLVQASFRDLESTLALLGVDSVDGVLLDLGVSSPQLDLPERGFRFGDAEHAPVPLDMRMDPSGGDTAADLLNRAPVEELERWLRDYGELPGARRLARRIVDERAGAPFETSADLVRVIEASGVGRGRRHHPATLVFQALRIAVNDELEALRLGLEAAIHVLCPGGRLVVIAYHSLEDRLVKQTLRSAARGCVCPPEIPVCVCGRRPTLRLVTRKAVRPESAEVRANPRARSARLRAAERIEEAA
ncbi:MAG: 16S rRNA (cytosine(1402)-N(4))-methyltransferase RsmH [Myxococcota bacterium]